MSLETDDLHCSCPDFELRGLPCKHVYAAAFFVQRRTVTETVTPDGDTVTTTVTETAAVRLTYSQNWPAYNQAQTQEKELFCRLLSDLCASVPEPVQEKGRPRVPVADALFSACFKVYSTVSSRRFMTDLRDDHRDGHVSRPWHFNTVLKVIEDPNLTDTLYALVTASAAPLRSVESTFAVDSTGFGTTLYYRHFAAKYGKEQYSHDWLKLHALVGTKTNVIAAASITDRNAHDSPQFAPLLNTGAETFNLAVVTADKAYASRANVAHVADLGGTPYIPMKSNAKAYSTQAHKAKDSMAWRWLFHLYNLHRDEFLSRYHARSNAEFHVLSDEAGIRGYAPQQDASVSGERTAVEGHPLTTSSV